MARTNRVKSGDDAHYHVIARANDRRFLFGGGRLKDGIVRLLKACAEFSGVSLDAYTVLDNHLHVVCLVPKPSEPVPEGEVLRRVAALKGARFAEELGRHWDGLRRDGRDVAADAALESWRRRMNDLSEFVKTFKELVHRLYVSEVGPRCGTLWSGRFKSTLVQGGEYLRTVVRYVELNAVRAGIVGRAADYRWSSCNGWKRADLLGKMGTVPEEEAWGGVGDEALMRRVPQIGGGVVFGSFGYVTRMVFWHGCAFRAGHVGAKPVFEGAYASHGHRLAG